MLKSFRNKELEKSYKQGKPLAFRTPSAIEIFDVLDVIAAAGAPRDASFAGFRFDEWNERGKVRYGIMTSEHWLISYSWSEGHAIEVDLERIA